MTLPLTLDRVLDELRTGDTAAALAFRLNEPAGKQARHAPVRVLPLLEQARSEGLVVRQVVGAKDPIVARWGFA